MTRVGVLSVVAVLAVLALAPAAHGTTFTVNTTTDTFDPCTGGACSLRGAIRSANEADGPDVVVVPASATSYVLTLTGTEEDGNATGDLDVTESLTIEGGGAENTIIDANGIDGVIQGVADDATLDISGVTIRGASDTGRGGVWNRGPRLTLTDSIVRNNGGDIAVAAFSGNDLPCDLTLLRTVVTQNTNSEATVNHGPDTDGTLHIEASEISGNAAETIIDANPAGGTKTVVEFFGSTFEDNAAQNYGLDVNPSGNVHDASLDVRGSTFRDNQIEDSDGLIDFDPASREALATTLRITDSVFSGLRAQSGVGVLLIDPSSNVSTAFDGRIERVRFEDNIVGGGAGDGTGGAIYFTPSSLGNGNQTFVVSDSLFRGNEARGEGADGGAMQVNGPAATTTVMNSTFTGNRAGTVGGSSTGGAISAQDGTFQVVNSTFDGNGVGGAGESSSGGGAIYIGGADLSLTHSTLTGNSTATGVGYGEPETGAGAGGLAIGNNSTATVTVTGTIVHGNTAFGAAMECSGTIGSGGSNLAGDTTCGFGAAGDQQGVADPGLVALSDNGGPTPTRALTASSPARNAAAASTCPSTDQRGVARPQEGACDIGAFEYQVPAPPSPPPDPGPPPPPLPGPLPPPAPPQSLLLSCARSNLALVDVVRAGGRVRITGQAAPSLAGRRVNLFVSSRTRKRVKAVQVGRALVAPDGSFAARVAKPPRRIRSPQYFARGGGARSTALELDRRMFVDGLALQAGQIVLRGHVTRPLPRRGTKVSVFVQTDCRTRALAGTTKLDRRGRFTMRFPAPPNVPEILVRAQTRVPVRRGRSTARTFTLPRPLRLG